MALLAIPPARVSLPRPATHASSHLADVNVRHYFISSRLGLEGPDSGLEVVRFGEYLVTHKVVDRFQLFRALQLQDAMPGTRIGTAIAMLGYCSALRIELMYGRFAAISTVEI